MEWPLIPNLTASLYSGAWIRRIQSMKFLTTTPPCFQAICNKGGGGCWSFDFWDRLRWRRRRKVWLWPVLYWFSFKNSCFRCQTPQNLSPAAHSFDYPWKESYSPPQAPKTLGSISIWKVGEIINNPPLVFGRFVTRGGVVATNSIDLFFQWNSRFIDVSDTCTGMLKDKL